MYNYTYTLQVLTRIKDLIQGLNLDASVPLIQGFNSPVYICIMHRYRVSKKHLKFLFVIDFRYKNTETFQFESQIFLEILTTDLRNPFFKIENEKTLENVHSIVSKIS